MSEYVSAEAVRKRCEAGLNWFGHGRRAPEDWTGSREMAQMQADQIRAYWLQRGVIIQVRAVDVGVGRARDGTMWGIRSNLPELWAQGKALR